MNDKIQSDEFQAAKKTPVFQNEKKVNKNYNSWLAIYKAHVRNVVLKNEPYNPGKVSYWRSAVFCNILTYLTPLTLIALIPSVIMSFISGVRVVGFADFLTFLFLILITVIPGIKLEIRKAIFIFIIYFLSLTLLCYLPIPAPGLLFLLTVPIFSSLIYSSSTTYLSAWINTLICFCFALLIYFRIEPTVYFGYNLGSWIAVSSNLVLLSFACAKCLDLLLGGLVNALHENRKAADKLKKSNRLYNFLSQINQSIVMIKNEQQLLDQCCKIAIEFGLYKTAWISMLDEKELLNIISIQGDEAVVKDLMKYSGIDYKAPQFRNTTLEIVLTTGKYNVKNNVQNYPEIKVFKQFYLQHNIKSTICFPLKMFGKVIGALGLHSSEQDIFNDDEIKLLDEAAGDISFALENFKKEEQHRQAEEKIVASQNRFRALIEHSADMKTLSGIDGKPFYASPSVTKILGYTTEEAMNIPAPEIIHPDDFPMFVENVQKILQAAGSSIVSQQRMKHKNGHYLWCEGTMTNMFHEPYVEAMVANFRDISEKKIIEQQQELSKTNLAALINNTNDLMWSVDRDFNLITSNKAFEEIVKLLSANTIEVTVGKNVLHLGFSQEQSLRYKKFYERAFAGEVFTEIEYTANPIEYWTEISFNPIKNGEVIIGTACHSHDITEIKKGEKQLKDSETFTRGILNSLNSNIAVIDRTGEIVAVNNSWNQFSLDNGETALELTGVGSNYFKVCENSGKAGNETAINVLLGLKSVVEEQAASFYLEYPCNSPITERWFSMHAMKFENGLPMFVVAHTNITDRKLAEENSFKNEERLKEAQSIAHMGNWEVDLVTNLHTWSDEFFNIHGIKKGGVQPSAKAFLSFIHPEDAIFVQKRMQKTFETSQPSSMNFRFIPKEGSIRYGYAEWKLECDNNIPVRLYGILQDITEQKKAAQILKESEARLAEAQAIAKVGNWETDLLTLNVIWSEQIYRIFDCTHDDFNSSHPDFLTFVHPDDRAKVDAAFKNSYHKKGIQIIEHRIITKSGKVKFIEERWQIFHDSNDVSVRAVGTCQDISERKKSEQENKFKAELLDTIGQATIATNLNGKVIFWNRAAVNMYGWTYEEAIGKSILDLTPSSQSKAEADVLIKKLSQGETWSGEFYVKRKDQSIFPAFVSNSPVYDEFGKQTGIIGVSTDISERKNIESERIKITNDLIQRNRDLEQFTFIISHNLRLPTANIIGFAEALSDESLTIEEQKDFLKGLSISVNGLDAIIKDLNTILQVKHEINEKKEIINFSKLVNDIKVSIGNLIDKHNVQIRPDFAEVVEIFSLKGYIHSIFYNLISNSIKYSKPDQAPLIEIKSKKENGNIILTFKDNGLGIDMKTKGDKIFGLYKRFHSHVEGKGMGLFMVKTQVEAIGGEIKISSEVGKGTEFSIIFANIN